MFREGSPNISFTSFLTGHVSRVTCHRSHVIFSLSFFLTKKVKIVGGGSVIKRANPLSFLMGLVKRFLFMNNIVYVKKLASTYLMNKYLKEERKKDETFPDFKIITK